MSVCRWLPLLMLVVAIPAASAQANHKQPTPPVVVSCELIEISASSADVASVDPALDKLKKKFKKPPFSSWNVFKVLTKLEQKLTQKKAEKLKLKLGQATATLLGIVNTSNVRLSISIDDATGKNWVNTTSTFAGGDYVVFGHSLPNNEGHLLALTCK
ncbi:MAG: hypothetical protein H0T42_17205 [Deltaproteobacteria bacterium]|nr:hypothetical protein [Deltaproteobacteria bacterium]